MGAGKSTIGRMLANRLSWSFVDTDALIEERTGADIPWIFDVEGEEGFRARESAVLNDVLDYENTVIATGGGIVMKQKNRDALKGQALVVYLSAGIDQLLERTSKDKKRPLLQVDDPKSKIEELYRLRDPLYREVATSIVTTDNRSPRNVVAEIATLLSNH